MKIFVVNCLMIAQIASISCQTFLAPIGSGCGTSEECVSNADCISSLCQCKPSFTLLSSLECKMDFDSKCSQESECNNAMGLHCIDSACKCSNEFEYVVDLGSCINSTARIMYQTVMALLNETEFELMRFTTLFNVFMIQAQDPSDNNAPAASEINPIYFQRLDEFQEEIIPAAQNPIPEVVPAPETPTTPDTDVAAQLESPQTTRPAFSIPNPVQTLFNVVSTARTAVQNAAAAEALPPPTSTIATGTRGPLQLTVVDDPPPTRGGNGLVSIIPNFIQMFTQFIPFLQGFNNVLSSTILRPAAQRQTTNNPPTATGNVNAGRVQGGGLFSLPLRLLQVPLRIFGSFFGANSPLAAIRQSLPRIDFSNRPIQFLPWPFG